MNQLTPPVQSLKTLWLATLFAIFLASLILIVGVLPAEHNIDITGLGKHLGLTALAPTKKPISKEISIKVVDPKQVEAEMKVDASSSNVPFWKDIITIIVPPQKGLEYKFYLEKNQTLGFEWTTNGAEIYFDFHGEPKGETTGYFKSYKLSTDKKSSGTLETPFAGIHGWYWKNKTTTPITITLKTKGTYNVLGIQ